MFVEKEVWGNIPLLHIHTEHMNEETPVVIFLHGFMSAKEHNLHYAYQLVHKGVRVLLPDAKFHGDRSQGLTEEQMNLKFWEIVLNSIQEVQQLYNDLKYKNLLASQQIGIAGTSMGGIVTSGCLKLYDWIQTATICMGAPGFIKLGEYQLRQFAKNGVDWPMSGEEIKKTNELLAKYDVSLTPEKFAGRPVLFWHGKLDKTVPFDETYKFYETLREYYKANPEDLQFLVNKKAGHAVSRDGMLAATEWLAQHLA
ncbi:prolyl oligopeptidase family serine peptidase [Lysinibacillus macroides]|uniref:Esterase n=1 Tax=Lysinibacillus macroides TaxID=33935 RepID=A0A0M9DL34_9BACI|nr:prolyl oligopeptidase family serine peptidase [Lysinibacillus macroides]KOY83628.1 esterase [Lysinibacillus macroides]QPR66548.1 prolyl oligopeptidase family serine peptidase [Lysinibacillus macroides]